MSEVFTSLGLMTGTSADGLDISLIKSDGESFFQEIKDLISSEDKVITTSYFVPHLSQRQLIRFPVGFDELKTINNYDVLILNPQDPGWGSSSEVQTKFINQAKLNNWDCNSLKENFEICQQNKN